MMKSSWLLFALSVSSTRGAVPMEECKETYLPALLECLDANESPCELLPIPDSALATETPNELGYWMQPLRETETTMVYALGDGSVTTLVVVDVAYDETTDGDGEGGGRRRTRSLRGLQGDSFEEQEMPEASEDGASSGVSASRSRSITFGLIDFPESYYQYGSDGMVVGIHTISAVGDILDMLGATVDEVTKVDMIYSHGHMDHIGGANYSYNAVKELGIENISVIGSEGTLHGFEELIEAGFFSYRAPLPTESFSGVMEYTIGVSSTIMLEEVNGHQFGGKDVVVFMEATEDDPAIMMMVDIVFPKWSPFFSLALTQDLFGYIKVHDKLLSYDLGDDGYFLGGHLTQVGSRMDIELNKNATLAILDAAGTALATTNIGAVLVGTGIFDPVNFNSGNQWFGFGAVFDEVIRVCSRIVLEQFGCTLAALDVVIGSHCNVAQNFLRLDI